MRIVISQTNNKPSVNYNKTAGKFFMSFHPLSHFKTQKYL